MQGKCFSSTIPDIVRENRFYLVYSSNQVAKVMHNILPSLCLLALTVIGVARYCHGKIKFVTAK